MESPHADVWALATVCVIFVLHFSFFSIEANGCACGHLSNSHLFYDLWVSFHLIPIKITQF